MALSLFAPGAWIAPSSAAFQISSIKYAFRHAFLICPETTALRAYVARIDACPSAQKALSDEADMVAHCQARAAA
jgi:hypothetical protein